MKEKWILSSNNIHWLFEISQTHYSSTIHYKPVGKSTKKKKDIPKFVEEHHSQGIINHLWANNCQIYLKSVSRKFFKLDYPNGSDQIPEVSNED